MKPKITVKTWSFPSLEDRSTVGVNSHEKIHREDVTMRSETCVSPAKSK